MTTCSNNARSRSGPYSSPFNTGRKSMSLELPSSKWTRNVNGAIVWNDSTRWIWCPAGACAAESRPTTSWTNNVALPVMLRSTGFSLGSKDHRTRSCPRASRAGRRWRGAPCGWSSAARWWCCSPSGLLTGNGVQARGLRIARRSTTSSRLSWWPHGRLLLRHSVRWRPPTCSPRSKVTGGAAHLPRRLL